MAHRSYFAQIGRRPQPKLRDSAGVLRVAKEKFSAENAAIVLVGKADEFRRLVEPLGKVEVIPIDKLNLDSPTLQ